jgi:hypothetical protein
MPKGLEYIGITICGLVIIGIMLSHTPIRDKLLGRKTVTAPSAPSSASYKNVLKIKQREPSNRPPIILEIALIVCLLILLAFGVLAICLWIKGEIAAPSGLSGILAFVFFVALPIWFLVDILILERKHYKSGESSVAKNKTIILYGEINEVFDGCIRVLGRMKVIPITIDKPKLFKGYLRSLLGNSIITLKTNKVRGGKVKIYVLSDAKWVTVTWDIFNVNQRNVDNFERLFLSNSSH